MKIPFSPPYIDDEVIAEVADTLRSGWITTGPKTRALEEALAAFTGSQGVACVNSWTSGAMLALQWFGVGRGDEVIVPAYTYAATALAVLRVGAIPVIVDAGGDFNITAGNIRKAVTPRTKAVIPVDFGGWPCDYDSIMAAAEELRTVFRPSNEVQRRLGRMLVLGDAAHSLGASYGGGMAGTLCDITVFSLHAVKNVTTAEGGAVSPNLPEPFDNRELCRELRLRSMNCQTRDALAKTEGGGWRYDITGVGMKANMADLNAAVGLAQMRRYPELLARRREIARRYAAAFSRYGWAEVPPLRNGEKESSCHLFALRIEGIGEERRDRIIELAAERGVALNVHFIPLPMFSLFKGLGCDIADYPTAYANYACEISLPIYPQLTDDEADYVVESIVRAYENSARR